MDGEADVADYFHDMMIHIGICNINLFKLSLKFNDDDDQMEVSRIMCISLRLFKNIKIYFGQLVIKVNSIEDCRIRFIFGPIW